MTPPTSALERAPLASCPWCEGEAVFLNDGDPEYPIRILDSHVEPCPLGFHTLQISYRNEADAAEAWNRRPLEDALARRAEAAEKECERLRVIAKVNNDYARMSRKGFDAASARVAELLDGLEPFAEATNPHKNENGLSKILIPCTVADIRRARALLTPIAEGR